MMGMAMILYLMASMHMFQKVIHLLHMGGCFKRLSGKQWLYGTQPGFKLIARKHAKTASAQGYLNSSGGCLLLHYKAAKCDSGKSAISSNRS